MCKCAGRGHDSKRISATKPGELATRVHIRGSIFRMAGIQPHPRLQDVNFKLKGRAQSSREKDPTLGPGWAYMVASDAYLKFLASHISEDEISHCVSFAALWSANNKRAKGLRASGVWLLFRPLGMGDLQWGERFKLDEYKLLEGDALHRYPNMDYIWFSSVMGIILLCIVASYDIACQWSRNFGKCAKLMPKNMRLPDGTDVIFKVPKFHLPPHITNVMGVGRTDGEGVERNWSWLNSAARSVSVMGPGAREDTIDNLCGFSNWKKTADMGNSFRNSLLRKMVLAIPQAMIHSRAFNSFTTGLRQEHEGELTKWEKMIREWEADPDDNPDPYDYAEDEATTTAEVLARLAAEDHARVERDGALALTIKPGPFLIAGINIQEAQAALRLEAKRINRTTIQATSLQRAQTLLLAKIKALHNIQDTYMPGLSTWLAEQMPPLPTGNNAKPETIPVYLPSSLPANVRQTVSGGRPAEGSGRLNNEEKEENHKARLLAGLPETADGGDIDEYGDVVEPTVLFNLEVGEGRRSLSWIWYSAATGGPDVKEDGTLHEDTDRVDQGPGPGRALERRAITSGGRNAAACWWIRVDSGHPGINPELAEGLRAYALEHAAQQKAWEVQRGKKWSAVHERARDVMRDHIVDVENLVPLEVELYEEGEEDFEEDEELL
ncbi:hypothetical protein K438DRAFT_1774163 [Mycena galopus ATCC 62051]|nr:hypothetical protein K438DRAFT_1774163 [Mycena galopus ATCC 62051]